ncbi:hypothetical protein L596_015150 [Steinernema carpocapsae]|uniref:Carbohydrate kinase PfkB domain-containing protein n=1 Tax=Steinernema carpocapsae TaxID=34508 RepID=A0A4U5NE40_STECR|nr:hypothetical protein L596_015150 [Steinernema carpocapsae]
MEKKDVVVFGSIVHDLVSYTDRFPRPGESVRGNLFQSGSGGKGANQCVAAARLGSSVGIIARVGNDIFGPINIENLKKAGVDTQNIRNGVHRNCYDHRFGGRRKFDCRDAWIELGTEFRAGGRIGILHHGPQANPLPERNRPRRQFACFANCKEVWSVDVLQSCPGHANIDKSILKFTDILCTNENEAEFITGKTLSTPEEFGNAALELLVEGPKIVIVTMGAKGALVAHRENGHKELKKIQTNKVKAVDTTDEVEPSERIELSFSQVLWSSTRVSSAASTGWT